MVLKDMNFTIKAGQRVAFVGSSGSGKSTVASLLAKLLIPTKGNIFIDDTPIESLNNEYLRTVIAFVPQEPVLFTMTVKQNLCLGFEVSESQLREACRIAYALDFIEKLPEGFETVIGAGGVQLSGGQNQRLALARALLRNPRILILDETTSALDTESEKKVQMALDASSSGRTTITIAHRLTTVINADRIFVFDNGKIVEQGDHNDLILTNGLYADFIRTQGITNLVCYKKPIINDIIETTNTDKMKQNFSIEV